MPERTACLYAKLPSARHVEEVAESMRALGASLADPESQTVASVDAEGELTFVSEAAFRAELVSSPEVRFLWQFSPQDRRYCRVRHELGVSIVEFGLEGYEQQEVDALRSVLETHFVAHASSSVGFVFDPEGSTEECDWDRFFLSDESVVADVWCDGLPDLLGLRAGAATTLGPLVSGMKVRHFGELVVLHR